MPQDATTTRIRATSAVRAGWAGVLLLVPERVFHLAGCPPTPAAVMVARVLGARQLVQAAVTAAAPAGPGVALGAVVDAVHGSTSLGLAAASPRWRAVALADTVVDAVLLAAGWFSARPRMTAKTPTCQ